LNRPVSLDKVTDQWTLIACSHNLPINLDKVTDQWNLRAYSHNLAVPSS
jgi:hypothetical protein